MADVPLIHQEGTSVTVHLSVPAATFLHGTVQHLNQVKLLPDHEPGAALQTSTWLEEIEARLKEALNG